MRHAILILLTACSMYEGPPPDADAPPVDTTARDQCFEILTWKCDMERDCAGPEAGTRCHEGVAEVCDRNQTVLSDLMMVACETQLSWSEGRCNDTLPGARLTAQAVMCVVAVNTW